MRERTIILAAIPGLVIAFMLTACSGTTEATPSPTQTPALSPVTATALLSAPVPAACNHPAGTLVDGRLPLPPGSGAMQLGWLDVPTSHDRWLVFGDLNGDGRPEAAAVLDCTTGMDPGPQIIAFYGPGPKLLGSVNLAALNLPGHVQGQSALVNDMIVRDGGVDVTWATQDDGDSVAGPTLAYSATLRWDGRSIVASKLIATTEVDTASQFLTDLRRGNTPAAFALAAPGVGAEAATEFRSYPNALKSAPACQGLLYPNLPERVKALVDSLIAAEIVHTDRICLLPADVDIGTHVVLGMKRTGFRHWQVAWIRVV